MRLAVPAVLKTLFCGLRLKEFEPLVAPLVPPCVRMNFISQLYYPHSPSVSFDYHFQHYKLLNGRYGTRKPILPVEGPFGAAGPVERLHLVLYPL